MLLSAYERDFLVALSMELLPTAESRFIPLISDYGFKATFGNETNSLFLRRALQALIQSDVAIEQVPFLPNELSRLSKDGRSGVYDVTVTRPGGVTVRFSATGGGAFPANVEAQIGVLRLTP